MEADNLLTNFDKLIISVAPEKPEGKEGYNRVDWRHVKDAYAKVQRNVN